MKLDTTSPLSLRKSPGSPVSVADSVLQFSQEEREKLTCEPLSELTSASRIENELQDLRKNPVPYYSDVMPMGNDLFNWEATLQGPEGSPYAGGLFRIWINFPRGYPITPPTIRFVTKIYHCNVLTDGSICGLDVVEEIEYTSALSMGFLLLYIYDLLKYPNPYNAQQTEPAKLWISDRSRYCNIAQTWTKRYAMDTHRATSLSGLSDDSSNSSIFISSSRPLFGSSGSDFDSAFADVYTTTKHASNVSSNKKAKSVRFLNRKRVKMIPNLSSMSDQIIEDCWFGTKDLEAIKASYKRIVFLMDIGARDLIERENESTRGLEHKTLDGKTLKFERKQNAYSAVFDEQEYQWIEDNEDPSVLAHLYQESSKNCIDIALAYAERDEREVQDYLTDTRNMLRNGRSCCGQNMKTFIAASA